MKKLFLAALLLLSVLPISALNPGDIIPAPLLVGHRGSSYGVENTEEAFRNGAKLGYQYVETDIKVTKDTKFVLCHNDDLSSFGHSSLTIDGSTLAQLQAVTLTQTRNSVKYTGKLMELGEFLDLCTELKILPVIELKWGTGVNSNDQSNMPALVKLIQDKGYYDKAIILTSMKPCLEWLKKNHPTMELQFLTGEYWASHFDWCVTNGIHVDIQASYFNAETVAKYHEKGLKVNMWTTNTAAGYTEYTLMGCDFITTDNLDGNNLPVVTVPEPDPTTKEVPDTTAYTIDLQLDYEDVAIAELESKTIKRVVPSLDGKYLYILAHAGSEATLIVYDHVNKSVKETLGTTNCVGDRTYVKGSTTGDVLALGNIDLADDGVLIGIGQSIVPTAKNEGVWLYKWDNGEDGIATGEAIAWHECTYIDDNGLWNNGECGEAMAYSGTSTNGSIYYSAVTAGGAKTRWVRIAIVDDEFTTYQNNQNDGFARSGALFIDALPTLPGKGDYIANQAGMQEQVVRMHADRRGVPTLIAATSVLPTAAVHTPVFAYNGAYYTVAATETGVVLSDISKGVHVGEVVQLNAPALTTSTTDNVAAAGTTYDKDLAIFVVRDGKISRYTTKTDETIGSETKHPILVGHRGSAYGVENTEEAFRNGAKLGYQYVETDIKVTADTKFVLCHNDDLSSFGHSSLTIAGSTLAQLQAVTLTQTRNSVKYTGKLMELGEFLDLCTELKILPVIELKWGTGVNSNDQSNMPALVKLIQDKGYYDKAIILTSMKPCLEWLNTNHPEIELQFLTGEYWASHFDWCVEKGIDVDIQRTYFDKTTVEKFHDAGLKVNMWTTNDGEEYKEHALWGCDFITTDHINGAFLPTLEDVSGDDFFPEVTTDYADPLEGSAIQPASAYNFKQEYVDYAIPELAGKTIRRMVAHANKYFILALDANNAPTIIVFDPVTKVVTPVSTEGITMPEKIAKGSASRMMLCSDIQVSSDGYLLAVSLAETTDVKGGLATIYKWEKDADDLPTGTPAAWISTQAAGFFVHSYTGETFAYSGSTETGIAYLSSESLDISAAPVRVALVPVKDGTCEQSYLSYCKPVIGSSTSQMRRGEIGADFRFTVSPLHARNIVVTGQGSTGTMVEFEMFSEDFSKTYNELPTALSIPSDLNHINYFSYAGATYAALPSDEGVILLDVTDGIQSAKEVITEGTILSATSGTAAVAGQVFVTKEGETITRGDIDLLLLRGDKATFLTTRSDKTTDLTHIEEATGAVTYYTITGVPVSAEGLTTGVYIRLQGNTATKVIIR